MCDYSLENVASRPAVVADRLVTTKFKNTITGGFAAIDNPSAAVCLLSGTELAFDAPPRYHSLFWPKTAACTVARFRQISSLQHRDALEFSDGTIVLLTRLLSDQRATVLQLPPAATVATGIEIGARSTRLMAEVPAIG